MNQHHLTILRTIARHQPILKDDLYRILAMPRRKDGHYSILNNLREEGYIDYNRHKGPVWLTVKGRGAIDEI